MICEKCQQEGKTSCVMVGGSTTTLMASYPYYDEKGKYHLNDPNTTTTYYNCTNGHQWTVTSNNRRRGSDV